MRPRSKMEMERRFPKPRKKMRTMRKKRERTARKERKEVRKERKMEKTKIILKKKLEMVSLSIFLISNFSTPLS